jgi:hypothetical protein
MEAGGTNLQADTFCHKRKLRDVMAITFCQAGVN